MTDDLYKTKLSDDHAVDTTTTVGRPASNGESLHQLPQTQKTHSRAILLGVLSSLVAAPVLWFVWGVYSFLESFGYGATLGGLGAGPTPARGTTFHELVLLGGVVAIVADVGIGVFVYRRTRRRRP